MGEEEFWDGDGELELRGRFLESGVGCESGITLGGVFQESACPWGRGVSCMPSEPTFPIFGWRFVHGVRAMSILVDFLATVSGMKAGVVYADRLGWVRIEAVGVSNPFPRSS